jgi:TATA-box binding protein (TBP) (component of TFIID and TFIIIB)
MSEQNIDDEWMQFINNNKNGDNKNGDNKDIKKKDVFNFDNNNNDYNYQTDNKIPEASDIYISTKSKIAFLNKPIELKLFWNVPIIAYSTPKDGVIKKQMKFVSTTKEEVEEILDKLKNEMYYEQQIMSHIDNPSSRIKYKDVRKVSIGISKKDIMSCRTKKKLAFYNCFVLIIRIKINNNFKEFHVKIFNTGKIEIPGIQNDNMYNIVLEYVINTLQPHVSEKLEYNSTTDTVLINSNFNCGFQINREILFDILKYKYKIHAIYDPCSYPGIQCKFYYDINSNMQNGIKKENSNNTVEASFMIFRTGSVLIVGMCEEHVLVDIYEFLKNIFKTEFHNICHQIIDTDILNKKDRKKKLRKRTIIIRQDNI